MVMGWPGTDLPVEENSPAPHVQTPVEVTRTRRLAANSAKRAHTMANANATLAISASDTIWFWLRIHDDTAADRAVAATGERQPQGRRRRTSPRACSGARPTRCRSARHRQAPAKLAGVERAPLGRPARVRSVGPARGSGERGGDLAGGNLDAFAINAVEFTQRGGDVEWASMRARSTLPAWSIPTSPTTRRRARR